MKKPNTIKLLDALNDMHGNMTELYHLSKPAHWPAYVLVTAEKGTDYNTGESVLTMCATDIRGVSLYVTTNPKRMTEYLSGFFLDRK